MSSTRGYRSSNSRIEFADRICRPRTTRRVAVTDFFIRHMWMSVHGSPTLENPMQRKARDVPPDRLEGLDRLAALHPP